VRRVEKIGVPRCGSCSIPDPEGWPLRRFVPPNRPTRALRALPTRPRFAAGRLGKCGRVVGALFRGVLGRCGRPRPARPLGRPGEDLPLEMRSPLPSQPRAGREEGSKDHGRARRTTAGLEGPRQGSKDHGRASNGPPPGSKACGWAQRRAAGLEGVRLGSKARGRAQGSPGWGHLESSLEGGRSCSAVGPPPAACSSSSSVRLDPREAQ